MSVRKLVLSNNARASDVNGIYRKGFDSNDAIVFNKLLEEALSKLDLQEVEGDAVFYHSGSGARLKNLVDLFGQSNNNPVTSL